MIKTPLSTAIGGAGIWTPGCTVIGSPSNINQLIKSLFADGTQGLYLNAQVDSSIADLSSIKDLSGYNYHAAQQNSTSRATIITDPSGYKSLKFDGIDDGYVTPSINFTNTDEVTVIAAVRKLSDANANIIVEFSDVIIKTGTFNLQAPDTSGLSRYSAKLNGNVASGQIAAVSPSNYPAPTSNVVTSKFDISAPDTKEIELRVDSVVVGNAITPLSGTGNFGNYPLYIGRRGGTSLPFNGQIYALLVIGKLLDDAATQRIEKEFAKYIGVTL